MFLLLTGVVLPWSQMTRLLVRDLSLSFELGKPSQSYRPSFCLVVDLDVLDIRWRTLSRQSSERLTPFPDVNPVNGITVIIGRVLEHRDSPRDTRSFKKVRIFIA